MDEIAGAMAYERLLLERLLYKTASLRHHLLTGQARWLAWAAEEVEYATARVREADLRRAAHLQAAIDRLPVEPEPGRELAALIEAAPEPYASIISRLRADIAALSSEIKAQMAAAREQAAAGAEGVRSVLASVTGGPDPREEPAAPVTYNADATWQPPVARPNISQAL
jgi:hypothetical protein